MLHVVRNDQNLRVVFILLAACLTCSFAGSYFEITRQAQDRFENPTVTTCDYNGRKFCEKTSSQCDWSGPTSGCCYCKCGYSKSTFNRSTYSCRRNENFRSGCQLLFWKVYGGQPITLLDLTKPGKSRVVWKTTSSDDVVRSNCQIASIVDSHNGLKVKKAFIFVDNVKKIDHEQIVIIKWDAIKILGSQGKVFKVNLNCSIERKIRGGKNYITETKCFVFKSSGKFTVPWPLLSSSESSLATGTRTSVQPSLPLPSSSRPFLAKSSEIISSHQNVKTLSPTSAYPDEIKPTRIVSSYNLAQTVIMSTFLREEPPFVKTISLAMVSSPSTVTSALLEKTVQVSSTLSFPGEETKQNKPFITSSASNMVEASKNIKSNPEADERSGGSGMKTAVISSAVVAFFAVAVAVVLAFFLWSRKRSERPSTEKENGNSTDFLGKEKKVDDPMVMNYLNNIYAEADDVVSARCTNGLKNSAYDCAESNAGNAYACLDNKLPEEKPNYQPLVTNGGNIYEHIPAQYSPAQHSNPGMSGQAGVSEPFYHVVEGKENTPPQGTQPVYSIIEEPTQSGNHDTLKRVAPSEPGNERPDRVYSTVEDENESDRPLKSSEADYLMVLPERSDYEQPCDRA